MNMLLEQFKTIFDRPEKVKKLREYILQLAVRGKLVEQDANDEPASVLLEKIKEEKERLIKEKKIKKEKSVKSISEDEIPYELPKGWQWTKLSQLYSIVRGSSPRPKGDPKYFTNKKTNYHWVTIKDITNFSVNDRLVDTVEYLTYEGSLKSRYIEEEEIIIAVSGSVGKSAIMGIDGYIYDGLVGMKFIIKNLVLRDYIYNYFKCWREKINSMSEGTSFPNINTDKLNNLIIPLPPLNEQKRIVEKVDLLMLFCDKLEKHLEKKIKYGALSSKSVFNSIGNCKSSDELEKVLKFIIMNFKELTLGDNAVKELKNAILQLAVQGKLVPQDKKDESASVLLEKIREEKERLIKAKKIKKQKELPEVSEDEIPYELPEGWEWTRLGCLGITQTGTTPSTKKQEYFNGNIPFIKPADITDKGIDFSNESLTEIGLQNGRLINKNSVLMVCIGGSIGKNYYIKRECSCNQQINTITGLSNIRCKFMYYFMSSIEFYNQVISNSTGSATPIINKSKWENLLIQLPPLNEQKRIVEKVDSLMELCDKLEKRIENSKRYSDKLMESILKDAFTVAED